MKISVNKQQTYHKVYLDYSLDIIEQLVLTEKEVAYIKEEYSLEKQQQIITLNRYDEKLFLCLSQNEDLEKIRIMGDDIQKIISKDKKSNFTFENFSDNEELTFAFIEGAILGNYYFDKYLSKKHDKLEEIFILSNFSQENISLLTNVCDAVIVARDLVNEPVTAINSISFAEKVKELGESAGFSVEVFNKTKLESLKFGGVLAVNKGSVDPPTFSIMEWKPKNPVNNNPYVFVGKGITFDSGGMNIKTDRYMEDMKSDMAGGATVAALLYLVAKENLPVHIIGLVPATDNRLNGNAMVSGDVITMFNGKTVEVTNTDAEGRLILADALSFADKYSPELVVDIATLTGAASRAIGPYGVVAMGKNFSNYMSELKLAGENVYERVVEFPFWDEYDKLNKSDIADVNNVSSGGAAGAITAGKFLANFTESPYIHLDIAGPAFIKKRMGYRGIGATGFGVRLLFSFLKHI
ncbi:leucyl aminopeptidase family protein [Bacteroidales bacterium OttesenSCG-928-K22]|nr:leucyl aminopeptidase family protein [Bacteroidales bacterium OttesenSCG-928-L14]MDL2240907.1 leucyl aminopeptidase family protein [Bacteroidales bacterium OttesenSCG-928-K22]